MDDYMIANINVDRSKPGYVIISEENWKEILFILADSGAEIDSYDEGNMIDYFNTVDKK